MKDSGVEWIGITPDNWNLKKAKYCFQQRNSKGNTNKVELLSPSQKFGVIPQTLLEELTTNTAVKVKESTDLASFKTIHKGDFCISLRSFQGGFEYCDYEGVVSPAYQVFFPLTKVDRRFYKYLFKDESFIGKMNSYTMSLRDGKNIAFSDFGNSLIPIPPFEEQKKIADFLDKICSEIDSLSADIQSQIDTLEKYKKSVITEAVTKGLNPNVEMKDSGIEWQKKIPNTWKLNKVKYISSSSFKGQGIKKDDVDIDGDFPCVRYGEIYSTYSNVIENCVSNILSKNMKKNQPVIKTNDILFAGTGELIEEIGKNVLYSGENICAVGGDIIVYRVRENPFFINYALNSVYCQNQKSCSKLKLKVVHISSFEIGNIKVFLPPLNEQQEIVNYLDKKCSEIEKTISEKQKQLETLEEYKKSLIYECVTGKKEIS